MESASARDANHPPRDADRTARARIRDAAIARFAAHGVAATSVKSIAAAAGVSSALVFHHFGSKEGLRAACDAYVLALVKEQKRQALTRPPRTDVLEMLRQEAEGPPVLRYLARMLTDGSEAAVALVDGMVEVSLASWEVGVQSGTLTPVADPRDLNVVLVLWSLGLLVLHDHAERLLGVDITDTPGQRTRYTHAAMEALRGLFTKEGYEHVQGLAGDDRKEGDDE